MGKQKKICPYCETVSRPGAVVCSGCGRAIPDDAREVLAPEDGLGPDQAEETVLDIPESALHRIVNGHSEYYVRVWKRMVRRKIPVSFHFPAFFFVSYWFVFRKMVKEAVLFTLIGLVGSLGIAFAGDQLTRHSAESGAAQLGSLLPVAQQAAREYYENRVESGDPDVAVINADQGIYQENRLEGTQAEFTIIMVRKEHLPDMVEQHERTGEPEFLDGLEGRADYQALAERESFKRTAKRFTFVAGLVFNLLLSAAAGMFANYLYFRRVEAIYRQNILSPERMAELGGVKVRSIFLYMAACSVAASVITTLVAAVFG